MHENPTEGSLRQEEISMTCEQCKPRTITTAEELDALGFQAVILDGCNTPYICERYATDRTRAEWQASGTSHLVESEDVLEFGPATVLYEPEASK